MMLHEPPTGISEIPAAPFDLAQAMTSAAKAIRQALAGLAPGSSFSLYSVLNAFRQVQRVSDLRRTQTKTPEQYRLAIDHAYSDYCSALGEWERHLPRLHGWLLAERARLRSRSNHARLVNAWIDADQQTK